MTALAIEAQRVRRGPPGAPAFAYGVLNGSKIYKGAIVGVTAAGAMKPAGTASVVAIVGIADRTLDNTAGSAVSADRVVAEKGVFQIVVPSADHSNITATVYAVDDGTTSLSSASGANLAMGTLVGIEGGKTYVKIVGS
jgi:hypothetical protein